MFPWWLIILTTLFWGLVPIFLAVALKFLHGTHVVQWIGLWTSMVSELGFAYANFENKVPWLKKNLKTIGLKENWKGDKFDFWCFHLFFSSWAYIVSKKVLGLLGSIRLRTKALNSRKPNSGEKHVQGLESQRYEYVSRFNHLLALQTWTHISSLLSQ